MGELNRFEVLQKMNKRYDFKVIRTGKLLDIKQNITQNYEKMNKKPTDNRKSCEENSDDSYFSAEVDTKVKKDRIKISGKDKKEYGGTKENKIDSDIKDDPDSIFEEGMEIKQAINNVKARKNVKVNLKTGIGKKTVSRNIDESEISDSSSEEEVDKIMEDLVDINSKINEKNKESKEFIQSGNEKIEDNLDVESDSSSNDEMETNINKIVNIFGAEELNERKGDIPSNSDSDVSFRSGANIKRKKANNVDENKDERRKNKNDESKSNSKSDDSDSSSDENIE